MDHSLNPYRPGAGTLPPELAGRDDLIARFRESCARLRNGLPGAHYIAIGLRGVGKTVLLNEFESQASDLGIAVAHVEADEALTFGLQISVAMRRLLLQLSPSDRIRDKVQLALRVLKGFTLCIPGGPEFRLDIQPLAGTGDSGSFEHDLVDLFVSVGQASEDANRPTLLAIDELQYLRHSDLAALATALHRCNQLSLPIMVIGAGLPNLQGKYGEAKSYAERLFTFLPLDQLSAPDSIRALQIPAQRSGGQFEEEALRLILEATEGYPYFIQSYGFHIWNVAQQSLMTADDYFAARPDIQEILDHSFFGVRLERSTSAEREYLRVMSSLGTGPHSLATIAQNAQFAEDATELSTSLINKGLIFADIEDRLAFTVPQFVGFLRRQYADEAEWMRLYLEDLGYTIPEGLSKEFVETSRRHGTDDIRTLGQAKLWSIFRREYFPTRGVLSASAFEVIVGNEMTRVQCRLSMNGVETAQYQVGSGPIDACAKCVSSAIGQRLEIVDYEEQAVLAGRIDDISDRKATAIAYVKASFGDRTMWGLAEDLSILDASLRAVVNAADRKLRHHGPVFRVP